MHIVREATKLAVKFTNLLSIKNNNANLAY